MGRTKETEVLVVGAGPVGLFAALSLRRRGVRVRVLDADFRSAGLSYACALHPRSLDLLAEAGAAERVLPEGRRVERIAFYEGEERRAEFPFARTGARHPFLLVLPQDAFERALEQALLASGPGPEWSREVASLAMDEAGVTVEVNELSKASGGYAVSTTEWIVERTDTVRAAFALGADGHRSTVRRSLSIDFKEVAPRRHFAVFEFDAEADPLDEVRVVLSPEGTSVLWPLPGDRCRFSFELPPGSETLADREKSRLAVPIGKGLYPQLSREDLFSFVAARAPWFSAEIGEIRWSLLVRFEQRLAASFGRGNAWLLGDAAHTAGPVGIRSMNVGLREAADFAEKLEGVLRGRGSRADLSACAGAYEAEWRALLLLDGPPAAADPWVREHVAQVAPCLPASGGDLGALLSGTA